MEISKQDKKLYISEELKELNPNLNQKMSEDDIVNFLDQKVPKIILIIILLKNIKKCLIYHLIIYQ